MCVEAEGACVADAGVAFVTMMGTDTGTCTRAAPCATIAFAISQSGTRRVIHVLGGSLSATGAVTLSGNRVIDGEDTTFGAGGTVFSIIEPSTVTIEGFRLAVAAGTMPPPVISANGFGATLTLDKMLFSGTGTYVAAGNSAEVKIRRSQFGNLATSGVVDCTNSKLRVDTSKFEGTFIESVTNSPCELIVAGNRFESNGDRSVAYTKGRVVMENNLIIHRNGLNDSILATNLSPGSTIRFNTIVNTTATPSDGAALSCDANVEVTSNIFAYNSGHPITGLGCATKFSVFDDVATTGAGTGNKLVPIGSIFVNRGAGDYHLSATSGARASAEPGQTMVTTDFDGNPRPNPAGTTADSGAFEAP